jgi:hypothetical protein
MLIYSIQQHCPTKDTRLDGNVNIHKESDSRLVDITAGDDLQGICDQKS